jgi:cell division transport system permease protein
MSGSYDRPDRPPGRGTFVPQGQDYAYDDPLGTSARAGTQTGAPMTVDPYAAEYTEVDLRQSGDTTLRPTQYEDVTQRDAFAQPRESRRSQQQNVTAPIVPAGSVTGRSLTMVITIMCFLACLTAGAVYMIRQSADAWLRDIASEVTVQIEPKDTGDPEKTVQDVASFLRKQAGIANVRPLSVDESAALLEPWLGQMDELKSLPVPRLIAVEMDRNASPNLDVVKTDLEKQFPAATLDDHRRWQQQIRTITRSFALGGVAILALVAMATMAIIVSATKSSMASNREIVEVLHFVGATDRFIAREFEKHFLRLGIRAGLVGAGLALAVFVTMPFVMQILGGGAVTVTELHRFVGTGALDMAGYVLLVIVVVVVAALCMLTSRFGVFRILNSKH